MSSPRLADVYCALRIAESGVFCNLSFYDCIDGDAALLCHGRVVDPFARSLLAPTPTSAPARGRTNRSKLIIGDLQCSRLLTILDLNC